MAPKDKDLEPLKDKKVVERYLRFLPELKEVVSVLIDPGPIRFETQTKKFDPETFMLELEITKESFGTLGRAELARLDNSTKDIRLSFAVNEVLFFAHGRISNRKERSLEMTVDLPVFKMQRRDAMRIKVLDSHEAKIQVGPKEYIPHDISASGISFVVTEGEEDAFPAKTVFPDCRLKFVGLNLLVDLEVVNVSRLRKDKGRFLKVGFCFLNLPASAEQKLAREAYLHTHKIWSRWI